MKYTPKDEMVSPILMSMLSTTIKWLIDEDEMDRAVQDYINEIDALNALSDAELAQKGITRDQITAYVLHETIEF